MKRRLQKYKIYDCVECDVQFTYAFNKPKTRGNRKRIFCPLCGDDIAVGVKKEMLMPRWNDKYKAWSEEEDQVLLYGKQKGSTAQEIAEILGRTKESVRRRYMRIK